MCKLFRNSMQESSSTVILVLGAKDRISSEKVYLHIITLENNKRGVDTK